MARILINNGTVVSATGSSPADVLVDGETIAALLEPGQAAALGINAEGWRRVIDLVLAPKPASV